MTKPIRKPDFEFELTPELRRQVAELISDLRNFADEADRAWHRHGLARWRESDEGTAVSAWVETVYDATDVLDNLPDEAIEKKPEG